MIDQSKTYRTKRGNAVRIYATDGSEANEYPVHGAFKQNGGWDMSTWTADGQHSRLAPSDLDLVESDPHGILPRHRELLAEAFSSFGSKDFFNGPDNAIAVRTRAFDDIFPAARAALIALARLDGEKGE